LDLAAGLEVFFTGGAGFLAFEAGLEGLGFGGDFFAACAAGFFTAFAGFLPLFLEGLLCFAGMARGGWG
jgi:hypothetical protein